MQVILKKTIEPGKNDFLHQVKSAPLVHLREMAFSFCFVTLFIKMSVIYSSFLTGGITQSGLKD